MATTYRYITYYIVLRDAAQVASLQAQFPQGYQFAPYNPGPPAGGAAIAFNASWSGTTDAPIAPFVNYVFSPEWTASNAYDQSVATFQRKTGGFWGIGGDTVRYYWVGRFVYRAPDTPTVSPPPAIAFPPKRRWIEGFEVGAMGPWETGLNGGNSIGPSRDAARHVGGYGLAIRGHSGGSAISLGNAKFNPGFQPLQSWERFYLRVRQIDGTQDVPFWEIFGTVGGNVGAQARIVQGGLAGHFQISIYKKQAGIYTFKQTLGDFLAWDGSDTSTTGFYRLDWLIIYSTGGSGGSLRLFVNGVLTGTVNFTTVEGGLGFEPAFHLGSGLGNQSGVANTLYVDIDDWMCADIPKITGVESLTSADFLHGTKIARCLPTTFGSAHDATAWPGDVSLVVQNPLTSGTTGGNPPPIQSSTSAGVLEVNTDADLTIDSDGALGCAAVAVSMYSSSVTGTDGALTIPGQTTLPATIDQQVATSPNEVFGTVDGTVTFPDRTPLKMRFTKAADANLVKVYALIAQVELTVASRLEDQRAIDLPVPPPSFPTLRGQHNAPYPRSPWAKDSLTAPVSPYIVVSGTYAGNSSGQDLNFEAPVHFIAVRPLTGSTGGFRWFSTMLGLHVASEQGIRTDLVNVDQDSTFIPGGGADFQQFRYRIRLTGNNTQVNVTGVTYHYVAICDPGARFLLCLDANNLNTNPTTVLKLANPTFTPEAALVVPESWTGITAGRPLMKGPSNGAAEISSFTGAAKLTAALTFGAGQITTQANLHALAALYGTRFCLFRRVDGLNDPGQPGALAILSWTGDGGASRTINIAPASGKRPIFAIASGDDSAGGYSRDAAHTTNTSSRHDGTSVTTAITGGGIDSISVGALLNVNLTNYNMLVLFGDATPGNGGFGVDGHFAPVQADQPIGMYPAVPDPSVFNPVVPPTPLVGEPDLDLTTPLSDNAHLINGLQGGQACEFYTRKAVNIALGRIGISKVINNLATDPTQEATVARKHVLECVNATLRAFDWPFATAYETLVLVGGTSSVPVNTDWQYSYRGPNRMIKARRIVPQNDARRGFDPVPIEFKLAGDTLGPLIYCNNATTTDVPLVLEFTTRVGCPTFFGDPMFRDALAWRFAAELAAELSRDEKRQQFCLAKFMDVFKSAEVPAAQEQQQAPEGNASWINDRDSGPIDVDWWKRQ